MVSVVELTADTGKVFALLQSYFQSGNINILLGSGASTPAITTAGSIEASVNALLQNGDETGADKKSFEFLYPLVNDHRGLILGNPSPDYALTLNRYRKFLAVIDKILFERKNLLLPRQANIFSTNYDMFVEYAATAIATLILNDGFVRSPGSDENQEFAPEVYFDRTFRSAQIYTQLAEMPTVNLIKMHGSLFWRASEGRISSGPPLISSLTEKNQAKPKKVKEYLKQFFLVLPNLNKHNQAMLDQTYYDLLRIYANSLDKENALLLSIGFSFRDEHILSITRRALRNPTAQLIIFAHGSGDAAGYVEKFSKHRNVVVIAPAADADISLPDVSDLLSSILPG